LSYASLFIQVFNFAKDIDSERLRLFCAAFASNIQNKNKNENEKEKEMENEKVGMEGDGPLISTSISSVDQIIKAGVAEILQRQLFNSDGTKRKKAQPKIIF